MVQDLVLQDLPVVFVVSKEHYSYYDHLFSKKMEMNLLSRVQTGGVVLIDCFANLYKGSDTGMLPVSESVPPTFSLHIPPKVKKVSFTPEPSVANFAKLLHVIEEVLEKNSKENVYVVFEDLSQVWVQAGVDGKEKNEAANTLKMLSLYHPKKVSVIANINQDFEDEGVLGNLLGLEDSHFEIHGNLSGYSKDVSGMIKMAGKPFIESQFYRFKVSEGNAELFEHKIICSPRAKNNIPLLCLATQCK
eukprot:TRINITY_DN10624_c0_g2_i2.p1 TRINITY_DN10624_c0_g2~~TRINITY_DN10624_c0_g2_i2.p1  ORF type:complete len:247 (-),score=50.80 TRINITY_DN10624_c0_g2_i2:693-1433(-)